MIYLDNAASTPLDPEIAAGIASRWAYAFANPSSSHGAGRTARKLLDESRERLASAIGGKGSQVIFTGGGTEALVLAIFGSAGPAPARIAISAVEHAAVRTAAETLRDRMGWQLDTVPVNSQGQVTPELLEEHLFPETRIVALMLANNEVGAISDVPTLAQLVRRRAPRAKFVTDAVQAMGKTKIDVQQLDVDLLIATAHKLHGPKGVGMLWARQPQSLRPWAAAGGQEQGLRGGTQTGPLAWGFAEAVDRMLAASHSELEARSIALFERLQDALPDIQLNGPAFGSERLCHLLSLTLPGVPGQPLLNALSARGVCVSSGSACSSGKAFSRTLQAMGKTPDDGGVIRLAISRFVSDEELDRAVAIFTEEAHSLRQVYSNP